MIEDINIAFVKSFNELTNNGINSNEALNESLGLLSNKLNNLDIAPEFTDSLGLQCVNIFKDAVQDGLSNSEALNSVVNHIKQSIENIESSSKNNSDNSNYDFNFLDPSDSANAQIINEGIAQGMSVEEAIKNANLKIFPEDNIQGPPTLAELKEINKKEEIIAEKSKPIDDENQELNIIEADMDAQELNNLSENTDNIDIQQDTEQIIGSENAKENNEDEMS